MKITEQDYIKAMRKANRELEIELHGKQCSLRKATYKTKKDYNRRDNRVIREEE